MYYNNLTCALDGMKGYTVNVEADIARGIPIFSIVGLADASIRESRERIKSAIVNSGLKFPGKKITINLSPSDIKKEGTHFDLPIALCILDSEYEYKKELYLKSAFIGELSLNGDVLGVNGIIPFIINGKKEKEIENIFIPKQNHLEAQVVGGINVIPVSNIKEAHQYLLGKTQISRDLEISSDWNFNMKEDFEEIKGNAVAKRGAEISAAGYHNLMMIGSAGSGKSMIAKRMLTIMGELQEEEYLEVSSIYSSCGLFSEEIKNRVRPFRSPHHSVTLKSIIGGGNNSSPGEVVLANKGILFLDEVLEFDKKTLEALRQPIEDKEVTISRVKRRYKYPCDFLLIACCNPCPCGNFNNPYKECKCQDNRIKSYLGRASTPFLDRFDIFVELLPGSYDEITRGNIEEKSEIIKVRVDKAKAVQRERYSKMDFFYNDGLEGKELDKYCELKGDAQDLMKLAYEKNRFSMRSYNKILKVARTISDLEGNEDIQIADISEALSYRKPLYKYWG